MTTIFSRIIKGEIPCHKIAEAQEFLAFLDVRPVAQGHTLVIPKREIDYIFDIEDDLLGRLMVYAKKISAAVKKEIPCRKIGVMVAGIEVPHAHIHLIPINSVADLSFSNAKPAAAEELSALAARIRGHLQS